MSKAGHNSKVKAGPVNADKLKAFATHLRTLREGFKDDCDTLMEDAEKAGIEKAALRRLVAWQGQDHVARAEREAIDEQYRFLAGERATPGVLPVEGMLAQAVGLYGRKATVRTVAEALKVSTGKAHKLKAQAAAFLVHVHADMNTDDGQPHGDPATVAGDETVTPAVPAHDETTGELISEEGGAPNPVRDGEASADEHERDASASSSPPTRAEIAQVGIFAESANNESCGSTEGRTQPAMRGAGSPAVETGGATLAVSPQAGVESGSQDTDWDSILASQPEALRRSSLSSRGEG